MSSLRGICGVSMRKLYELAATKDLIYSNRDSASSLRSESISSTSSPAKLSDFDHSAWEQVIIDKEQRRFENENGSPKRKRYCIPNNPMNVHFVMTMKRIKESKAQSAKLNDISKIILRAKYLNELIIDNTNIHWKQRMSGILKYCLKIHELRCPFLIECTEEHHNFINYISSRFIMDLCKYLEHRIPSLHRLIDCLVFDFKIKNVTHQILVLPDLNMNGVICAFYLLPPTAFTSSLITDVHEVFSLKTQQKFLRNVLEELECTMLSDVKLFVFKWCKQIIIQILADEFSVVSRRESRLFSTSLSNSSSFKAISNAIAKSDMLNDRNQTRMQLNRKERGRTTVDNNICSLLEIDWQRSIQRLHATINDEVEQKINENDSNDPVLLHYDIPIPKHRKYADKKDNLRNRTPLFRWFANYGFKAIHKAKLAFIVSHDHTFRFEGAQYLNKIYHSKLTDSAVIVLIFDADKDMINAYYLEQSKKNIIQFENHSKQNDDAVLKYLNAPFMKEEEMKQKKRPRLILTSISTTTSNTIDSESNNKNDTLSPLSPATSQTVLVKSKSLDIAGQMELDKMNGIDNENEEEKETTAYILPAMRSFSASTIMQRNEMQTMIVSAQSNAKNKDNEKETKIRVRRWSFSENAGDYEKRNVNGIDAMEFKHALIDNIMKKALPEIIRDIVSLWYVLPDCELTFLSLIDAINIYDEHGDNEQQRRHRLNVKDIDLSRLKKLRKYFWRKPLKYMVQQYLAESKKEENALVKILTSLQCAVVSGDSLLSFASFIKCCKNNSKFGRLIVSTKIINSPSIHLFILVKPIHNSQQPLLIHFFLSEKDKKVSPKENDEGVEDRNGNKKLVMETIGRCKPKKSGMNRQCLSDLISMTEVFIKKRNIL